MFEETGPDFLHYGFGSRIVPKRNKCPISTGRNFTLEETLRLAVNAKNAVAMWGPYEIKKEAFDLGVKRKRLLDGGTIRCRAAAAGAPDPSAFHPNVSVSFAPIYIC